MKMEERDRLIREEGIAKGIEKGIVRGEARLLIQKTCGKLQRGKSPEQIAEELDETAEKIQEICRTAAAYAPDYDAEKIYSELVNLWEQSGRI